jgi:hypothetical protein
MNPVSNSIFWLVSYSKYALLLFFFFIRDRWLIIRMCVWPAGLSGSSGGVARCHLLSFLLFPVLPVSFCPSDWRLFHTASHTSYTISICHASYRFLGILLGPLNTSRWEHCTVWKCLVPNIQWHNVTSQKNWYLVHTISEPRELGWYIILCQARSC